MAWDDLSKNHKAWPSAKEVRDYRQQVCVRYTVMDLHHVSCWLLWIGNECMSLLMHIHTTDQPNANKKKTTGVRHRQAHHPDPPRLPLAGRRYRAIPLLVRRHGLRARAHPPRDLLRCACVLSVDWRFGPGASIRGSVRPPNPPLPPPSKQQYPILNTYTTYSTPKTHHHSPLPRAALKARAAPATVAPPPPGHIRQAQPPLPPRGTWV